MFFGNEVPLPFVFRLFYFKIGVNQFKKNSHYGFIP